MSGVVWKDWNPQRVKANIAAATAKNMEVACKVVETTARKNLMAISTPDWGRGYRQKVLAPRIIYEIEINASFVEGRVGIKRGKRSGGRKRDEHGRFVSGEASDEYHGAYYIEIGSKRIPAHPWLRPALLNHARDIVRILEGG